MTDTGVCSNVRCTKGASGEEVERYPGAGEFCPECGERLTLTGEAASSPEPRPQTAMRAFRWTRKATAIVLAAFLAGALLVVPSLASRYFGGTVRVCSTSMTDRLVAEVVHAYAARNNISPSLFAVGPARTDVCDVRFWTGVDGAKSAVLAHDALVVVVNPRNPVSRLSSDQVRAIFSGSVVDWSQVGGAPGPIEALYPSDESDEIQALRSMLFHDMRIGDRIRRVASSAQIVQSVAAANGARAVGIVPFSAAVPAKVVALKAATPPSTLSIADHRYPLAVRVLLESDLRSPSPRSAALIDFARSGDGETIVARNGFVGKDGF